MAALVELSGAAFGYEKGPVVAGVDLTIGAGDFVGIVGPNGAGKTTLFRGILGLIQPLEGTVRRAGARIGYVPQRESLDALFPLTAQEVVEMGAYGRLSRLRRLAREDRREASATIARLGLGDRSRAAFESLSGGQRQRILIARALMSHPNLLLLDEPTSGVDRAAQAQILELLRELNRDGLAILLVSHQLAMVRSAVRRLLWIGAGRAALLDPTQALGPEGLDVLFSSIAKGALEEQPGP